MLNNALKEYLELFFDASKLNRLPKQVGGEKIFSSPLIGVAKGDDPIFQKYKEVVGPEHLTPLELWFADDLEMIDASKLRIISIIFPLPEPIVNMVYI